MAGGKHNADYPLKRDPAIERYGQMHATMHERFRFTPKVTRQVIWYAFVVPMALYLAVDYGYDRWDISLKKRGETFLKQPSPPKEG